MRAAERWTSPAIDAIEGPYRFKNPEEVRYFLFLRPDLLDVVTEGIVEIPEHVPTDQPIDLEVVWDAEDADDDGELIAVVQARLEPEDVVSRMERLRRDWLIAALRRVQDPSFTVGVEYR